MPRHLIRRSGGGRAYKSHIIRAAPLLISLLMPLAAGGSGNENGPENDRCRLPGSAGDDRLDQRGRCQTASPQGLQDRSRSWPSKARLPLETLMHQRVSDLRGPARCPPRLSRWRQGPGAEPCGPILETAEQRRVTLFSRNFRYVTLHLGISRRALTFAADEPISPAFRSAAPTARSKGSPTPMPSDSSCPCRHG